MFRCVQQDLEKGCWMCAERHGLGCKLSSFEKILAHTHNTHSTLGTESTHRTPKLIMFSDFETCTCINMALHLYQSL